MNWKIINGRNVVPVIGSIASLAGILLFLSFLFPYPDAWARLASIPSFNSKNTYPSDLSFSLADYKFRRPSITTTKGSLGDNGIYLETSWPRSLFSGPVLVPWKDVEACGLTVWCPKKDTNFWLGQHGIEITLRDTGNRVLKVCESYNVPALSSNLYSGVKSGSVSIDEIKKTASSNDIKSGC